MSPVRSCPARAVARARIGVRAVPGARTLVLVLLAAFAAAPTADAEPAVSGVPDAPVAADTLRVMSWNIWRGGREDGADVGPRRVVDVIRDSGADLVAMQETYGSGERIAGDLGFTFVPRGTNVSIHSRHPVLEDVSVHEPFMCVGALVELPSGRRVAIYSVWLPYDEEIWAEGTRDVSDVPSMLAACRSSAVNLRLIRDAIEDRLSGPAYDGVPIVIAGDFNAMSHLDYREVAREQYGTVIDWPTSRVMSEAGYRDAYRVCVPHVDRAADRTWTPRFPGQEQDRIDFIHVLGRGLEPVAASVIDTHEEGFPSDHAAVMATLRVGEPAAAARAPVVVRAATANIRHGRGMDGRVDLDRVVAGLRRLNADVIALQEVDERAGRSGRVNQAAELGRRMGMHAAFGPFMDFDGGRYGMAVLSRHPIHGVRLLRLPAGNEPRVALLVEVRLPTGEVLTVVDVHLDWVADDGFRFEQASELAEALRALDTPVLLLGDFNDGPESRTLGLFRAFAMEADKPEDERLTFPAEEPDREIDFVLAAPPVRWRVEAVRVIPEMVASDHRPVVATLELRPRED